MQAAYWAVALIAVLVAAALVWSAVAMKSPIPNPQSPVNTINEAPSDTATSSYSTSTSNP